MERKTYRIGRLTYYQEELTWKQDRQLMEILGKLFQAMEDDREVTLGELWATARKNQFLMGRIVDIILKPRWNVWYFLYFLRQLLLFPFRWRIQWVNIDAFTNSDLQEVQRDFFSFNSSLIAKLKSLGEVLGLIAKQAMPETMPTEKPSSSMRRNPTKRKKSNVVG